MDAVDEEWEAFLGALPDPSDCSFLSVASDIPPIHVQEEESPEFWRDDSVNGSEEASWSMIAMGGSPIEDERCLSSEKRSKEWLGDASIVVSSDESWKPAYEGLTEGFPLVDTQECPFLDRMASKLNAIESFLMEGDEVEEINPDDAREFVEKFLDAHGDDPTSSSADPDLEVLDRSSPDVEVLDRSSPDVEVLDRSSDSVEKETRDDSSGKDEDDSVPLSKKRKRQLRNRDSALRSRERKKMYVKDLEAKSRFFEFECRRLEQVLALCYAENHALRLRLHNFEADQNVVAAKQESAVLRLESLLLGSLLCLATLVWSVLFPALEAAVEVAGAEKGNKGVLVLVPTAPAKRTASDGGSRFGFPLLMRRFKAARKKMRADSLVHGLAGFITRCASSAFACFPKSLFV